MNYYPFHIGDYVSATRHLSWEEDAAFRRLLDTYYTTEKPIPVDLRAACRLVMAQTDSQREAVKVVLEEFFALTPEGWVNKRADDEIAVMRDKQQKQRDKANKRWHKPEAEPGIAAASDPDAAASKTHADAMPPTPTPTPTPEKELSKASPSHPPAEADGAEKTPTIPCPYRDIVAAYHDALPSLPQVRIFDGKGWNVRCKAMRELWGWVLSSRRADGTRRAMNGDEAMAWVRSFFAMASKNDFVMNRVPRSGEHANWRADLDYLLSTKGIRQVVEKTQEAA